MLKGSIYREISGFILKKSFFSPHFVWGRSFPSNVIGLEIGVRKKKISDFRLLHMGAWAGMDAALFGLRSKLFPVIGQ